MSDFLTIAQAAHLIANRKLSPVELIEDKLKRIEKVDSKLNSFICVLADEARIAAKQAEAQIAAGDYRGPLHGIPIGLKDIYDMAGVATTAHSKIMQDAIASTDSHVVAQLKQAGAIILGKLATHECALGGPSFDLPWPPARNPWDTTRFTGGSSSGSGAAVAAGLVLGSAAGDTGGSIRTPSAYCGIAGLKPTYGLISREGMFPLAYSLDHAGPMAWTAEDCALMLQGMVGEGVDYKKGLTNDVQGMRVGLLRHFYANDNKANEATYNAIEAAAKKLEEMGCEVEELQLSLLSEWAACGTLIMIAEAYAIHEFNLQTRFMDYGEVFRDRMALAGLISSADYIAALRRRRELIDEFDKAMHNFDIILTATTAREAPKLEEVSKFSVFEHPLLTMPFNVTGSPAMSVCCGYTEEGLPLAMQLVGKRFADATVLRIADAYERATPWRNRRPNIQ